MRALFFQRKTQFSMSLFSIARYVGVSIAGIILISVNGLCACDCSKKNSKQEPEVVFAGSFAGFDTGNRLMFFVEKIWKGDSDVRFGRIVLVDQHDDCRYLFDDEGKKKYLVYAYASSNMYWTNICAGTKELSAANNELKRLGPGRVPVQEPASDDKR